MFLFNRDDSIMGKIVNIKKGHDWCFISKEMLTDYQLENMFVDFDFGLLSLKKS